MIAKPFKLHKSLAIILPKSLCTAKSITHETPIYIPDEELVLESDTHIKKDIFYRIGDYLVPINKQ